MRSSGLVAALAATLANTACTTTREVSSRVEVRVESTPPGAMVTVSDGSGRRALGRAPLVHEVDYVEMRHESGPGMWVTAGISAAATAIGVGLLVGGLGSDVRAGDGTLIREGADDSGMIVSGGTLAGLGGTMFLVAFPLALVQSALDGDVLWSMPRHGPTAYEADLPGHRGASAVLATTTERPWKVELALAEDSEGGVVSGVGGLGVFGAGSAAEQGGGLLARLEPAPFVAVFDVEDRTGALDGSVIAALTDQLATKLAELRAFRVVPAADLRARLVEAKKSSYGACIDERCQIELGKAVAADRTVSARIIKVGDSCTVNGTVYDLKTEATDRAASVRAACAAEALSGAIDELAAKLSGG